MQNNQNQSQTAFNSNSSVIISFETKEKKEEFLRARKFFEGVPMWYPTGQRWCERQEDLLFDQKLIEYGILDPYELTDDLPGDEDEEFYWTWELEYLEKEKKLQNIFKTVEWCMEVRAKEPIGLEALKVAYDAHVQVITEWAPGVEWRRVVHYVPPTITEVFKRRAVAFAAMCHMWYTLNQVLTRDAAEDALLWVLIGDVQELRTLFGQRRAYSVRVVLNVLRVDEEGILLALPSGEGIFLIYYQMWFGCMRNTEASVRATLRAITARDAVQRLRTLVLDAGTSHNADQLAEFRWNDERHLDNWNEVVRQIEHIGVVESGDN